MILMIDNYDSFTYNLVQYLGELGQQVLVFRNDCIQIDEINRLKPDRIIISPGPCTPLEAGISNDVIRQFGSKTPILGVCLGHQCIAHTFGARIVRADRLMHGKTSMIYHDGKGVYQGLCNPFEATRYHSLIVDPQSMTNCLEVTAKTDQEEIMGIRHLEFPVEGVQFHPESILTQCGMELLKNFINLSPLSS